MARKLSCTRRGGSSLCRNALPSTRPLPPARSSRRRDSGILRARRAPEWAAFLTDVLGEAPRKKPRHRAPHQTHDWLCSPWSWCQRFLLLAQTTQQSLPCPDLGSAQGPEERASTLGAGKRDWLPAPSEGRPPEHSHPGSGLSSQPSVLHPAADPQPYLRCLRRSSPKS